MIHREEESQLTAATVKLAKTVTCVTYSIYNIAQDKEKIKYFIDSAR